MALFSASAASPHLGFSTPAGSRLLHSPSSACPLSLSWRASQLTSGSHQKLPRQQAGAVPGSHGGGLASVRRVRGPVAEQFVDKEGERKEGEKGGDEGKSSPALKTVLQAAQEERDGRDRAPNTILRARREHPPSKLQSAKGPSEHESQDDPDRDRLLAECANAVRLLAVDSVNNIKAGHPGSAMGLAHLGVLLFSEFLRFNPANPGWANRDRFVMSNGHACLLQYILLHLTGYDLQIEDLKQLCKLGSRTPGHPENHVTQGIEVVTGPLGQGFANAVGLALAESVQAARFNTDEIPVFDHYTYVIFGDGCAMEGVTNEAGSLAGHWGLGKLIAFYDSNEVTIDGHTDITFTEDVMGRYAALGWHTQRVPWEQYGDFESLRRAIKAAQQETGRPSVIQLDTCIGYGSPSKEGTPKAHHGAFGEEETPEIRKRYGRDPDEGPFTVPDAVYRHMRRALEKGAQEEASWKARVEQYAQRYPDKFLDLHTRLNQELPRGWEKHVPTWTGDEAPDATRGYSERCLNEIAEGIPGLLGGSADLGSSNKTLLKEEGDYGRGNRATRNIRYGVREHAMGAISNGLALHATGLVPYASTFLVFSDYMRPAIRLAALSGAGVIFVFSHDSIGLGEDGPTHQPVEQIPSLRAIPNLVVLRPGDGQETSGAYRVALGRRHAPTALLLSRQKLTAHLKGSSQDGVARGAYVLCQHSAGKGGVGGGVQGGEGNGVEGEGLEVVLLSSGSELVLCQEAAEKLQEKGISSRVVSMVSWELFRAQPQQYRDSVIPPKASLRLAVEAASPMGWSEWLGPHGETLSVSRFGSSGNYLEVFKAYGFTVENVVQRCEDMVRSWTFL